MLTGEGTAYTLFSIDAHDKYNTGSEMLRKWAASQRKRRSAPKGKLARKCAALDKQIRILEKRLSRNWRWNEAPPKNPFIVRPQEFGPNDKNWRRDSAVCEWQAEITNRKLRPALYLLGRQTWKHWGDLRKACAMIGAALPEKMPKNRLTDKPWRLVEVNSLTLIYLCGADAYGRDKEEYWHSHGHYLKQRADWLEQRRERKAPERELADLQELRAMPEKLAESDIGLPEGVTVEA